MLQRNFSSGAKAQFTLRSDVRALRPTQGRLKLRPSKKQINAQLLWGAVGVEEDFAGLAGLEEGKGVFEIVEGEAFAEERFKIEAIVLEEFGHLHPRLKHFAAVDSLDRGAFEDHVVDEIEGDGIFGDAEEGGASAGAKHFEALVNSGGIAAHFEHHVHAIAAGGFQDALDDVSRGGVERFVRTHFDCQLAAVRVYFGGEEGSTAGSARDSDGHQADRAGAGDDYVQTGNFTGEHGVNRVAERVHNGSVMLGNSGIDFPDIAHGNADEFGETAVRVDAEDFDILADVRLAHAAWAAMAAIDMHFRADEISRFDGGDFVADFLHDAAEFVAEGERRLDAGSGPTIPAVNVKIGAADGSGANANENLRGAERWNGDGFDLRAAFRAHLTECLHRGSRHGALAGCVRSAGVNMLAHGFWRRKRARR